MLDHIECDQDRHELLNALCKMCSRQRTIPDSMRIGNCLNGELIEEYDGGQANIFRGKHKGRPVAVKIMRLYLTSDFHKCLSVKTLPPYLAEVTSDHSVSRYSAEKLPRGDIFDTQTSYRCWV